MGSVREEIRQSRPFSSPADEGVVTLLRTADTVRRALAGAAAPRGITLQQYNVLRILRGAGPEGLPTLDVAARMIETTPGITRLLDRLERKGFVRRKRCPNDHRRVLCAATEKGLRALDLLDAPMSEVARQILEPLGDAHLRKLIRLLDHTREAAFPLVTERTRRARPARSR